MWGRKPTYVFAWLELYPFHIYLPMELSTCSCICVPFFKCTVLPFLVHSIVHRMVNPNVILSVHVVDKGLTHLPEFKF